MSGGLDARSEAQLAALAAAPRVIRRRLQAGLRDAGKDGARAAAARIRRAASRHDGTLREEIAATLTVRTTATVARAQVAITAEPRKMPPGKESLPFHANTGKWRHPVYGNREVWRTQKWPSAEGWFGRTLSGRAEEMAARMGRALDEALEEIGR